MPKIAKALTALDVKRLTEAKLHPVGTVPGLALYISKTGAKSWILRTTIGTRRSDMGLGPYPAVTLAGAIERARETLNTIRAGVDPVAAKRAKQSTIEWTFERCALSYIAGHEAGWKNVKHGQQWRNTLETYVYPVFGNKHVRDVEISDVIRVIEPHWTTKNETMVRVRNRIELVLSWAAARNYRSKENPARWRGNLDQVLPKPSKVNQRESFEAMPVDAMHDFMRRLRGVPGTSARALEFVILTACRSGEARMASWSEIDLQLATWTLPKERMKAGRAHRVPLSDQALELLEALPRFDKVDLLFPGREGKPLSDMAMTALMRRLGLTAVPHGFRSTFTDWAAERTGYPSEVREMALAHAIGNDTEAAYRRGDLFDKRRQLMADWAAFLDTPPASGNVVRINRRA
ncbi:MAG: integrase arm-type DNA-binding domain-containing protein [Rhodoferax sp.]|nr:integrase arm-type DNA-binding domain-containing protein [Rhodoferax sp.]MCP5263661.1 integrase arm-type DNA-binding domain-containing protein [Rhodoferax sp.]